MCCLLKEENLFSIPCVAVSLKYEVLYKFDPEYKFMPLWPFKWHSSAV